MRKAQGLVALLACMGALSACRIQRGGAGETSYVDDTVDAAHSAAAGARADGSQPEPQREPPASTLDSSTPGAVANPLGQPADTSPNDAGVAASAADSDAGSALDAGKTPDRGDAVGCGDALDVKVCNPIANTGCADALGMQCDVDLLATALSGQCVFSAPASDASTCLNIPPTETCPAGHTCVNFSECRKLCTCDSDCDAGDCCDEPLGDHGFKTCTHC